MVESSVLHRSIDLPSRGVLYEGKLPGGHIKCKLWTTAIEEMFSQGQGSPNSLITEILDRSLVDLPFDSSRQLLTGDRYYAFFMLRAESYGDQYGFPVRCSSCGFQFRKEISITKDLDLIVLPDGVQEPFQVELPYSKDVLGIRLLRGYDEEEIEQHVDRLRKQRLKGVKGLKLGPGGQIIKAPDLGSNDPTYRLRLARHIVSINGEAVDGTQALAYVSDMVGMDSQELRQVIDEIDPRFDMRLFVDCQSCGFPNEMILPFTSEFLFPRSSRQRTTQKATRT